MDLVLANRHLKKLTTAVSRYLLLACILLAPLQVTAAQQAIIVSSADNNYHKSLIENILPYLETSDINANIFNTEQQMDIGASDNLIISIGHEATTLIDNKKISNPILRVYTETSPNIDPDKKGKPHLSMTQATCKQFALARLLNANWKTVSVLLSSPNELLTKRLESCAAENKLILKTIILNKFINIIDALNTSLLNSDALLALPDSSIYNAKTIKSILLTSYRHRVPIIGFSENFVRAGALAAINSSEKQLGKQIAELIQQHYNNQNIIDHHLYPKYFDVITNKNVAKSLGITLPEVSPYQIASYLQKN